MSIRAPKMLLHVDAKHRAGSEFSKFVILCTNVFCLHIQMQADFDVSVYEFVCCVYVCVCVCLNTAHLFVIQLC